MSWHRKIVLFGFVFAACLPAHAQTAPQGPQASGTVVTIPAYGEVSHANDEARATFMIEEQDKDKANAASRVNMKMKQGTDILRREQPQAKFKTHSYYAYPVYPDDQARQGNKLRQPVAWRIGQFLEMTTTDLSALPRSVAAVQRVLALNGLQFGLSEITTKKLDEQRIEAAYRHLNERILAIAKAMGRKPAEAMLEGIELEPATPLLPQSEMTNAKMGMRAPAADSAPVEEPSFEPGETNLQLRLVAKVRFK